MSTLSRPGKETVISPSLFSARERSKSYFSAYAWFVLLFNLPVILWGAYVRVSFSGDGCGANWPFCNGQVIPQKMSVPTAIEFTHRLMTSADSVLVIGLCLGAFWLFPRRHAVRRFAVWSLVFLLIEALLGAGLVLFRLVARDQSAGRIWYLGAHLTNTLLLLGALTITAWSVSRRTAQISVRRLRTSLLGALAATVAVSVTGAIAALGDTLFPVSSLAAGFRQDFSTASTVLLRLRFLHPVLAVSAVAYILWAAIGVLRETKSSISKRACLLVCLITIFQLITGATTLSLLAPLSLQLFHLMVADVLWVTIWIATLEASNFAKTAPLLAVKIPAQLS